MQGNLAARAGRWSAQHRKKAIFGWLAFVILAVVIGGAIGMKEQKQSDQYTGESGRAERALDRHGLVPQASETILVRSGTLTAEDGRFRAAVADVQRRVSSVDSVEALRSPYATDGAISKDRHSALVQFEIEGDAEEAVEKIEPVMAQVEAAQKANPTLSIQHGGDASGQKQVETLFEEDLAKAETLSLPITLLILVVAFGAIVAAGVPVLLAFSAVLATTGLVAIPSQIFPVSDAMSSVILLIGMAVGVDYSLFYLRREREEREAGHSSSVALQRAAATSGRAVLISGITVMAAMAGMFLTGDKTFMSFGIGTILVVGVAMIGSLTVLPALLSKMGDKVMRGRVRVPFRSRRPRRARGSMWSAIVDRVMRRPVVALVVAGGALLALSVPALELKMQPPATTDYPSSLSTIRAVENIQAEFPSESNQATVVVQADDVWAPDVRNAILRFKQDAASTEGVIGKVEDVYSDDGQVARLLVPMVGDGTDDASQAALAELRTGLIPATFGGVSGTEVNVTGYAAATDDFNTLMSERLPIVFAFVLSLTFLLLLSTFRSIVVPIKAIALNLLSVGAAYGTLVLVFQKGYGEGLLGFESNGAIVSWLPLFLFVILFGLSMDYHVFILSRVREAFDRGMTTDDAVAHGIKSTAGVVTSAALVMVAVFAIFGTLSTLDMKQMGIGLAVAVLIDATIIRAVLLPASMKLLGDRNWYLPKRLEWMPKLSHEAA